MKIRILNNSIRLRLSQLEVQQLAQAEAIIGHVPFPDGASWTYQLQCEEQEELFKAQLSQNSIRISIAKKAGQAFEKSDLIGHEGILQTPDSTLKILVEKDFKCLTPRKEEESGLFENPHSTC